MILNLNILNQRLESLRIPTLEDLYKEMYDHPLIHRELKKLERTTPKRFESAFLPYQVTDKNIQSEAHECI